VTGLFLAALLACGGGMPTAPSAPSTEASTAARDVDVQTFAADIAAGKVAVVLDVRTPDEFATGHVPDARNIPLDELMARAEEIKALSTGEVYVICRSGGRSARGASALAAHGIPAVNVVGGTLAWVAAGQPTE
jgi:thioredoxin 1